MSFSNLPNVTQLVNYNETKRLMQRMLLVSFYFQLQLYWAVPYEFWLIPTILTHIPHEKYHVSFKFLPQRFSEAMRAPRYRVSPEVLWVRTGGQVHQIFFFWGDIPMHFRDFGMKSPQWLFFLASYFPCSFFLSKIILAFKSWLRLFFQQSSYEHHW